MRALTLLTFAAAAIACDATPTAPNARPAAPTRVNAAIVTNERSDQVFVLFNTCDNSPVDAEFTMHTVFSITVDDTGGQHIGVHQNINGHGVNEATGVKYVWNRAFNESTILDVGTEHTVAYREYLISQGPTDNFVLLEKSHLTFTPNGDITSLNYEFEVECRA